MTLLLTAVLLGIGFTILAIQNTANVNLQAGGYVLAQVPLYIVILASFSFGIFLSWVIGSIGWISSSMAIHSKDSSLRTKDREIERLSQRVYELENEKVDLKHQKDSVVNNQKVHNHEKHPNLLDRVRYNLS